MLKKTLLILAAACLAAGALVVTGCGDDKKSDTTAETSAPASGGGSTDVSIKDIKFNPQTITVKVGDTVKWTNDDAVAHNVVATKGADFKSDDLNQGDTYEWKAAKAGTIDYECTIHPGQTGSIKVEA